MAAEHAPSVTRRLSAVRAVGLGVVLRRGRDLLPYAAFVVIVVYFATSTDTFLSPDNLATLIRQSATLMVIAIGSTLVIVSGSIDLSVGGIAALAGTIGAYESVNGHPAAVWFIALIGAAAGLVNGVLIAVVRLPSFLVTLGTLSVFTGSAVYLVGGAPLTIDNQVLVEAVNGTTVLGIPNGGWWALGAVLTVTLLAYRTAFGRHVYAVGGNERVAELAGIPVRFVKITVFALSGLLAGIGAMMILGQQGGSSPSMGDAFLLQSIAAVVIGGTGLSGGVGGPLRTVLGVFTIVFLANGMTLLSVNPFLQSIVFGLVVIVAVAISFRRSELTEIK